MLIVGEGKNRREALRGVVDDKLPAKLAIQGSQTSGHKSRKVAFDDPLLQLY